jgi:hypothetical protein
LRRYQSVLVVSIFFLLIAFAGGLVWANVRFARTRPGGASFGVYWASIRTMLYERPVQQAQLTPTASSEAITPTIAAGLPAEGTPQATPAATAAPKIQPVSPYSLKAAQNSQQLVYGRLAQPGEPPLHLDIPLHAAIIVFPFAAIDDFILARGVWMLLLEVALIASVFLCLAAFRFKPRWEMLVVMLLFILFWPHGLWSIILGDMVVIAAFLIALVFWALNAGFDELAGIALGLLTFKFMAVGPFILFMLVWGASQRRWRMLFVFTMTLSIFIAVSFLFYPNWLWPYLQAQVANLRVVPGFTPVRFLGNAFPAAGQSLGWIVTGFIALLILMEWWLGRRKSLHWAFWMASLVLVLTPFSGIPAFPQNYIVLLPVFMLILSVASGRWEQAGRVAIYGVLLIIFLGLWAILLVSRSSTSLYFPLPILLLVALYWVRWWFIRPPRTWADSFKNLP